MEAYEEQAEQMKRMKSYNQLLEKGNDDFVDDLTASNAQRSSLEDMLSRTQSENQKLKSEMVVVLTLWNTVLSDT